ncbi:DUF3991 and TOPRIM domain-containing protein [Domibacillus iocasae]|uniref:DUF3991 domain-containing protein n=1 Tax=Domibacillus iocasae TaxID=1714016 RepID=A0A1E7DKZ3_9BACI|nr:DUF3991 and TOPRIM domain-containing protein [Domibacillus iocasae]OES43358.1 hypothetical protein BA724_14000 [Domibacillus iocasae]
MGDRVSKAEIDQASEIHVLDYLQTKGEPLLQQGDNYYRHAEHDSLVFNTNGKWYWNSRNTGGMGAISLARELYGMKFQEAVRDVNGLKITKTMDFSKDTNKEFIYPNHYEVSSIENAKNYLVNERCIDEKVVLALRKHDLIAEDKLKNIVFKWKDKVGKIVGADRQGTTKMENKRGSFKQIMAGSKSDGGFTLDIGRPNKIAFFESPIDLVSYYDMIRPDHIRLLSMSGLKDHTFTTGIKETIVECNERNDTFEKVIIAVDNDAAGEKFSQKWEQILGDEMLQIDVPKNKDWNDDLKQQRALERQKQNQIVPPFSKNKEAEYER